MRVLELLGALLIYGGTAMAQTEQPGVFHEPATGLTMRFPVELVPRDAQKAIDDGHIAAFGAMQTEAKQHELASRCIKPLILAELPENPTQGSHAADAGTAVLMFFEFIANKECKADFKYKDDESVAGGVAQTAIQIPGAVPLSRPLWFDYGKQKLHASFAAIGLQNTSADQPHALIMTAAMRYHGRILGWVLSAGQLDTFNGLTKTSIQLDDGKNYPLAGFNLDDHLGLPVQVVK